MAIKLPKRGSSDQKRCSRPSARLTKRRRLSLQSLESRRLLAVYIVDSFLDSAIGLCAPGGTGNDGCSLRSAIIAANNNPGPDSIDIPAGNYNLSIPPTPGEEGGDFEITDDLTITGIGDTGQVASIAGNSLDRVFSIFALDPATPIAVSFINLDVQGGLSPQGSPGGGIQAGRNTTLTLTDSLVRFNRVDTSIADFGDADGGGIATSGNLVLNNTDVQFNFAEDFGGGIAVFEAGIVTIKDALISDNTAGNQGGGLWAGNGEDYQISITDTDFFRNRSTSAEGGGLYVAGAGIAGSVILNQVAFRLNEAGLGGGGVQVSDVSSLIQTGGTYDGNASADAGGGLLVFNNGSVMVDGTVFAGNTAVSGGGGAAVYTAATFRNTLFQQNSVTGSPLPGVIRFDLGGGGIAAAQQSSVRPLLRIEDSSILGNTAALAAGIGSANSFVEIINSIVDGNQAMGNVGGGGGIGFAQDDVSGDPAARVRLTITNSTISNNVSDSEAGGIGIADADAIITDATITGNTASGGRGGGIGLIGFANAPTMQLDRVTIDNNTAGSDGGGIAVQDAGFAMVNTTLSDNAAGNNGGGLAYGNSNPALAGSVEFSTIASNQSGQFGSNVAVSSSVTRFLSTIVADPQGSPPALNFVSGGPGQLVSRGNNLVSDLSSSFAATGDQVNVDPLLGPLADNGGAVRTRALLAQSPAIDAGATSTLAVDARGSARPIDGDGDSVAVNDVGAFEAAQAAISIIADDSQLTTDEDVNATIDLAALTTVTGSTTTPTFTITTQPASGTVTISGATATFDPADDVFTTPNTLLTFVYTASVGGASDTGTITVSITAVNDPPVFVGDTAISAVQGIATTITGSTLTSNDLPGPPNETEAVTIFNVTPISTQGGTAVLNGQDIVYTSAAGFTGTDTLTYNISDGTVTTNATLTINVNLPAGVTVTANDATLAVTEDISTTLDLAALVTVTGSATAPTLTITTQPASGTATLSGPTLTYDPAADDFTTTPLTLVYTATVGSASDTGTITINIAAVNDPPVVVGDLAVSAVRGVTTTITGSTLTVNDEPGPENESGTVAIGSVVGTSAQGGTVTLSGENIEYTPPADPSIMIDTITYTVIDDQGASATASLDVDLLNSNVTQTHVLSTGSGDGDVTIEVDSLGAFGSNVLMSREAGAVYDPIGAVTASTSVFDSRVGIKSSTGIFEPLQAANANAAIQVPISGNLQTANSQFSIGPYTVSLVQAVAPNVNSAGERLGAQLTQTYVITNTSGVGQDLDLVRYLDADLLFDSTLNDGGGVLFDAAGNIVLFETDKGGAGSTDTTFVGITNSGGEALTSNRFEIDQFSRLRTKLFSSSTASLADTIFNDSDADGFVDAGSEYDVELALASRFALAPGSAATFTTRTLFGTRPTSVAPPSSTTLTGQVSCDANGNGLLDPNEASVGVSVFVDENGNRRLDNGEVGTTTDSTGTYSFSGLDIATGQTATVVVQNPPSCAAMAPDIGVTRSLLTTGALSRGIVAADIDNDGDQELLVVNELGNDVSVLVNNGNAGGFSQGNAIPVGKRPVAITSWQPDGSASPVIAVAAVGTGANRGSIYVIENGQLSRELSAGDGPISVAVNDFNGDGQADFVAATLRSGTIVGRMSGETEERVLAQARGPKSITAGLLNNDSFVDLVVVAYGYEGDESSDVIVLLGDGRGNFTPRPQQISGRGSVDVAVANFDDDAADEIVVASYNGSVRVFDLDGSVLTSIASLSTETGVESVAAADVNGDGRTDLAIANSKAETIELFINQASGFVRNRTISGVPSPSDLVVANLDGDNVLDIAVSNLYGTVRPSYKLPSSATVLGLTVTDREITFTSNQSVQDFTFRGTPLTPQVAAAWAAREFDVDYSGSVSARDALVVINSLSRQHRGEGEGASSKSRYKLDVNQDGQVTALDALLVINHMSRVRRDEIAPGDLLAAPAEGESSRHQQAVDALMSDLGDLF